MIFLGTKNGRTKRFSPSFVAVVGSGINILNTDQGFHSLPDVLLGHLGDERLELAHSLVLALLKVKILNKVMVKSSLKSLSDQITLMRIWSRFFSLICGSRSSSSPK